MNAAKMKGLGRGLDALLAGNEASDAAESRSGQLAVGQLQPGKYQPRTQMDAASLEELAASIRAQGLMQPILVRGIGADRYEIIAGERRWRASQLAGLKEVPVLIRDIPDEAALAMALIENIQREDLNPLEEAMGLQRLIDEFGMTHQQVADAVGRQRTTVSNLLRLLQLAPPVQDLLLEARIDMGHARALLPLPGAEQVRIAQQAAGRGLSVREVERLVQRLLQADASPARRQKTVDADLQRLQEELADALGAKVTIVAGKGGRGRITVDYASLDQLDGIIVHLRRG
jgi:ParB family chromosome partitioning protein